MCLDAHAHGVRVDHEIFRSPHAVELTFEERATPATYVHHPAGAGLGETMPMWRVQTEGYLDGTHQLIGIVSRDAGFHDSPDVEWISSGVNSKGPEAVALGRHGNFFHWGFAASPTYLTDEARLVLVNALHYIARFDGVTPVARKVAGSMPRSSLEQMLAGITDEGYARTEAQYAGYRAEDAARKAEIQARQDAGEELSEFDRMVLASPPIQTPDRFDRVRGMVPDDTWAELGEDPARVEAWLRERMPFMRAEGWYELVVDEELRAFGVANDDLALLERAVAALATEEDAALARVLLERYTDEAFETADAWSSWLEHNAGRLFFSETAGYKWLVDVHAPVRRELEPTPAQPFDADASASVLDDGRVELVVRVAILDGWHAYDRVAGHTPYRPLRLQAEAPEGWSADGDWSKPVARLDPTSPGTTHFVGELEFRRTFAPGAGAAPPTELRCTLGYQVCNDHMCMPPTTTELVARVMR